MEVKTPKQKTHVRSHTAADWFPQTADARRILHERAMHYAKIPVVKDNSSTITTYVKFKLGENEYYGIPYQFTKEVIHDVAITPVPHTPSYVVGVINLRSVLITVIDLKEIFHLQKNTETKSNTIIIVSTNNLTLGVLVDSLEGSDSYQTEMLETPIASEGILKNEYLLGLHNNNTTIVNIEAITSDPALLVKRKKN